MLLLLRNPSNIKQEGTLEGDAFVQVRQDVQLHRHQKSEPCICLLLWFMVVKWSVYVRFRSSSHQYERIWIQFCFQGSTHEVIGQLRTSAGINWRLKKKQQSAERMFVMQRRGWDLLCRKVILWLSNPAGVSRPNRMYPLASGLNAVMLYAPTLPRYAKGLRGASVSGAEGASQGSGMWQKARGHLADQEMAEDDKPSWMLIENDKERTGSEHLNSSRLLGGG